MLTTDIEKVVSALQGIVSRDTELITRHVNPSKFIQHSPSVADGLEGLKEELSQPPGESDHLEVVRAFQDGPYVFAQSNGLIGGLGVFFDIFRFEEGVMVEHWLFSAPAAPPNESGHTQTDGPTEAKNLQDTEKNKSFLREYTSLEIVANLGNISPVIIAFGTNPASKMGSERSSMTWSSSCSTAPSMNSSSCWDRATSFSSPQRERMTASRPSTWTYTASKTRRSSSTGASPKKFRPRGN